MLECILSLMKKCIYISISILTHKNKHQMYLVFLNQVVRIKIWDTKNKYTRRRYSNFNNNSSSAQVNLIRYINNLISSIITLEIPLLMTISEYLIVLIPKRVLVSHHQVINSKDLNNKHNMVILSL